ncbi:MAG: hypothetical protein ACTSO7_06100 [Candidatus Heimdallarchaeota archaeon]
MSNNKFLKICGVSSILSVASYVGTMIFTLVANIGKPESIDVVGQHLVNWYNVNGLMSAYGWFGILGSLFTLPAIIGYYKYLEKEKEMQWIPAVIIFHGVLLLTLAYIIPLVISQGIAPSYIAGGTAEQLASLESIAYVLILLEDFFAIIGTILTLATGIALIGIFDLKKSIFPKWVNWLAIVTGVLSFGFLGTLASGTVLLVFQIITIIDLVLMLAWMVIVGVLLILKKEEKEE